MKPPNRPLDPAAIATTAMYRMATFSNPTLSRKGANTMPIRMLASRGGEPGQHSRKSDVFSVYASLLERGGGGSRVKRYPIPGSVRK